MKFRIQSAISFSKKTCREQKIFAEAFILIGLTSFVINYLPFSILNRIIKHRQPANGNCIDSVNDLEIIMSLVRTIQAVSRHVPWQSKCLTQSATGKIMLNRRHYPSTLHLGIIKEYQAHQDMKPHAWLEAGNKVILGGENLDKYIVVSSF